MVSVYILARGTIRHVATTFVPGERYPSSFVSRPVPSLWHTPEWTASALSPPALGPFPDTAARLRPGRMAENRRLLQASSG